MKQIYFTITVSSEKEPDNQYDAEAIKVTIKGLCRLVTLQIQRIQ